jgi:acetyltransferase-like isoleucine patch superfamily enzyme/glycosyltransferase involved in cell wall biosynthesis
MIDVLIQTHNEELNLPHTLASLQGWVNHIFVVDSGSTDHTCEIAASFGATIVQKAWLGYARQKNWALSTLPFTSDWILILDADESVTPELKEELLQIAERPVEGVPQAGFYLNRLTIFMGREIRHCGYFPAWNLRFFKRGRALYEDRNVHEHMIVQGSTGHLRHLLLHEDRRGLEHFIAKHNRYSTLEAMEIYRHREKWPGLRGFMKDRVARRRYVKYRVMPKLAMPWLLRFFYMYFIKGGILDRRAGLDFCLVISTYQLLIRVKYDELVRNGGVEPTSVHGLAIGEGNSAARKLAGDKDFVVFQPKLAPPGTEFPKVEPEAAVQVAALPEVLVKRQTTEVARGSNRSRGIATKLSAPNHRQVIVSPWKPMENLKRAVWMIVRATLFRTSFHNWYGWRRLLLRMFGAKLGQRVRVRPTAWIEIPWHLEIQDDVVIGDYAIIYSLGNISIGRNSTISQYAHLCAGTHDYTLREFPLLKPPIVIGEEVWIAADAFIGPGVKVGDRSVVGARANVVKDVPPDQVVVGASAVFIKQREFRD